MTRFAEDSSEAGRFDHVPPNVAQHDLWRQIIDPAVGIGAFMRPMPPELIILHG
jgi:hypothetical protein